MSPSDRQTRIWKSLDANLTPYERTRIIFIVADTPESTPRSRICAPPDNLSHRNSSARATLPGYESGVAKIVGQNHQFLGVNNAIAAVKKYQLASSPPDVAKETIAARRRLGVFWHTQGSGNPSRTRSMGYRRRTTRPSS